jgi:hypothetical protein
MATKRWTGNAIDVAQVTKWTVINTWATNDTATVGVNGKELVLTVGTASTVTDVAADIVAMINGTAAGTGYSRTETGDNVPELQNITAANVAGVITLTADDAGVPFTVTIEETVVAGSGEITANGDTTAATGKNFFSDADNWSPNGVPVDSDDILFEDNSVSVLYGLSQGSLTPTSIKIKQNYTGEIGLPLTNTDDPANPYAEYRGDYLVIGNATDAKDIQIEIGEGDGAGSGRLKIDTDDSEVSYSIVNSGPRADSSLPAILLQIFDANSTLEIDKGDVGVGYNNSTLDMASIKVGWLTDQIGDSSLVLNDGIDSPVQITQTGGSIALNGSGAYVTTLTIYGGETITGTEVTSMVIVTVEAGTFDYRGDGTITTLIVGSDATATFGHNQQSRTVTNCSLYEGGTLRDPAKTVTWTNGIDLQHTSIHDGNTEKVTLDIGTHLTITPSAI